MKERKRLRLAPIMVLLVISSIVLGFVAQQRGLALNCPGCSGAYASGNCTCYAWQRASGSDAWNNQFPTNLGHAYRWDNNAPGEGYQVGTIPYLNAIAVWEGNVYPANTSLGHVAYVTNVLGDANHTFQVTQMNLNGHLGCIFPGEYSARNMGENLHFIYPPSSTPEQLLPYEGYWVEYGESAELRWYGNWDSYQLWIEVIRGGSGPPENAEFFSHVWGIEGTSVDLYDFEDPDAFSGRHWGWPNGWPLVQGTYWWQVKGCNDGGSCTAWSDWQFFHLVDCYYSSQSMGASTQDTHYCPPGSVNPTPMPTSTPFPTPTDEPPNPTDIPTPAPTDEPPPTETPEPQPTAPSPADLKQASDLEFSPPDPSVGDEVHFWVKARNDGGEAIEVTEIGPFGYGPGHTPWDANRHGTLEIAPFGGEETIHGYRTFDEAGIWTVDGIHFQLPSDPEPRSYYDLPSDGYRATGMDVVVRGPSDLRQCLDLEFRSETDPEDPRATKVMLGEKVRFCTDLCNYGDQVSNFKYFGPEGRAPDGRNWDAFIEDAFSIPPGGHPYTFDMFRRFYKVGEWYVDRLAVQETDDWLTRYTLPSDGHLQSFNFDVVADPDHLVTFAEVIGSDREYRVAKNLGVGDQYYTDRDYTILSLPEGFENLTWIMTSNEDDRQTREEFLYFALNSDSDVCIAYDQRVNPLPYWMDNFGDTGLFLEVSDHMASLLRIYCQHYPVGRVMLGGNLGPGTDGDDPVSNYVVLVGKEEKATPTPSATPTATATATPTASASPLPTGTNTPSPTSSATVTSTPTGTPTPTVVFNYQFYLPLIVIDI